MSDARAMQVIVTIVYIIASIVLMLVSAGERDVLGSTILVFDLAGYLALALPATGLYIGLMVASTTMSSASTDELERARAREESGNE